VLENRPLARAMIAGCFTAVLLVVLENAPPGRAQDIVGLEDCAQAKGPDKKIGCLQANVEFLHRLIKKNEVAAQAKLREETARSTTVAAKLDELQAEIARLKSALEQLEKRMPKPQTPQPK
jgi:hypothetical protein